MVLQSSLRQPTIDHDYLAGGVRKIPSYQSRDRFTDILGKSPTWLQGKSFSNQLIIFFRDDAGHVGFNDSLLIIWILLFFTDVELPFIIW